MQPEDIPEDQDEHGSGWIGPFRVSGSLGAGGGGVVYRAVHGETGQVVALKTVRVAHAALLHGIRREIQVLARLRHPGIVRIVAEGAQDGVPWYAMELIEGSTLLQHCRDNQPGRTVPAKTITNLDLLSALAEDPRKLPEALLSGKSNKPGIKGLRNVLTVVRRLCTPLAYLHGEGIVHRDIKPTNVLVRADGFPILVDFGLTALFGGETGRESLEVLGGLSGTVAYMAPEQIQGGAVDARADLYSLGCVLYELLTGRPPFLDKDPRVVLHQHLTAQPVAPSQFEPAVPAETDSLVLALLAKSPWERLGHADDVAAALERSGAEPSPPPDPVPRAYLYRPGLAGREETLRTLDDALYRLDDGQGGLALIGGESGVGKTRLATELTRRAARLGVRVLTGSCVATLPSGNGVSVPLQALKESLQAIADRCREFGLVETEDLLGERGKLLALYEPALRGLPGQEHYPEPVELPAEAARVRLNAFLTETFLALARPDQRVPARILLLLDDLQWADEMSLSFLEFLLRGGHLDEAPLLVVGTYRSEEASEGLRRLLDAAKAHGILPLLLGRLGQEAVSVMVGDMLALSPPPMAFSGFLARQSEGNPFFVAEYLRGAISEKLLYRSAAGDWRIADQRTDGATVGLFEGLPLPLSLRDLVSRRLTLLTPDAFGLVEAAAVLGREADVELTAEVAKIELMKAWEALVELRIRHVIEETGASQLRFTHDKIREVAYAGLAAERRRELHRQAAQALESQNAGEGHENPALVGGHWDKAGFSAKARPYYLTGARRGLTAFAYEEAERLYRSYLSLVVDTNLESVDVRAEMARDILLPRAKISDALLELQQAVQEAQSIGNLELEARGLHLLGIAYRMGNAHGPSEMVLEKALTIQHTLGDRAAESATLLELGLNAFQQGHLDKAAGLYQQALDCQRGTKHGSNEPRILNYLSIVHGAQGRTERAAQTLAEARLRLRELGDQPGESMVLGNLGTLHGAQGNWEAAVQCYEESNQINRQIGHRWLEALCLGNLANIHWLMDQVPEATSLMEKALALNRALGNRRSESLNLSNLAGLRLAQGHPKEAAELYERAMAIQRQIGARLYEASTSCFFAIFERRSSGHLQMAEELLNQAETIAGELRAAETLLWCTCERGHLELAAGRPATDLLLDAQAMAAAGRNGPNSDVGRAVGRLERAVAAFERGEPLFRGERVEDLPEGLRRWLRDSGALDEAKAKPAKRPRVKRSSTASAPGEPKSGGKRRSSGQEGDGRERPRAT